MKPDVWSCGGGTQSIAIAALIVSGRLPAPDYSVIADTGYERSSTWEYLAFLQTHLLITRIQSAKYATVGLWGGKAKNTLLIPAFTNLYGRASKLSGFCSNEWKRRVINRWLREQGVRKSRNWIGFSTDEKHRATDADDYYPLIELGMSRNDCMALIARMGWPQPVRSSCWMCPNHGAKEWLEIQQSEDWEKVIQFEEAIQKIDPNAWLLKTIEPIAQANFRNPNGDLFESSDCESGVCFV